MENNLVYVEAFKDVSDEKAIIAFLKESDVMLSQIKSKNLHNIPFIKISGGRRISGALPWNGIYRINANGKNLGYKIRFNNMTVTPYLSINKIVVAINQVRTVLTRRLRELETVKKKYDKLPTGPYGKVFAGDERRLPEPNNEKETDILTAIEVHLVDNEPLSGKETNTIKNVIEKGLYKDIIKEPKQKVIFRGMALALKDVKKLMKKIPNQRTIINLKKPVKFKPNAGKSSSWTKSQDVAMAFASNEMSFISKPYNIILVADSSKNENKFFDLSEYYKQIDDRYKDEMEVIGLGEILVSKIIFDLND